MRGASGRVPERPGISAKLNTGWLPRRLARALAHHEARRALVLLAGRLRARHGWRAYAAALEMASAALAASEIGGEEGR